MMSRDGCANLPDGRVELQVSGEDEEVAAFLRAIRKSALGNHISSERSSEVEINALSKAFA